MQTQSIPWEQHVATAWREGLTMGAYAKKYDLAASTVYGWQQKLRLRQATAIDAGAPASFNAAPQDIEPGVAVPAGKFLALRITSDKPDQSAQSIVLAPARCAPPAPCAPIVEHIDAMVPTDAAPNPGHIHAPHNWTLILPGSIRIQMHALPEPAWLVALSRCAQGVH